MKKIINGKLYDTETAKEIAGDSYNGSVTDFHYWEETLYKKRTGEYFLYGKGGPLSKYAKRYEQNGRVGGEAIQPMTYAEATAWAEEHMDADDYMDEFGPVSEDSERVAMSISLDSATADRIRREAAESGVSISALIASKFR